MEQPPQPLPPADEGASQPPQSNYVLRSRLAGLPTLFQPSPTLIPRRGWLWYFGIVLIIVLSILGTTVFSHKSPLLFFSPVKVTATPTMIDTTPMTTYFAAIPGPGCDMHGGVWKADFDTQTSCLADRLHVTASDGVGIVDFFGTSSSNPFPQNYEVGVDIAPGNALDAGITVHQTAQNQSAFSDGYEFDIDATGGWVIRTRLSDGSANFPSGTVTAASQYHLDVIVHGATEILAINGIRVSQFTATTMTGGNSISFIVYGLSDQAQADYKNFVFKTLS